ncbi:TerB-C domain-containing protein [Chryseobacterium carnipullorum]|uniref:tellurite resistance TerB C-terminal domain-containing protein n=1 Tax=Chryseobacterium carnipullorum TaxID=1124835 RepID=UPI0009182248|nr:tellurite resistance TerB C-terminal domain-containing protein [Chryseobacterium carnipullorum]SHM40702.1 TerB-C domain-containing protein [Chryseobacterium carnipullorum]
MMQNEHDDSIIDVSGSTDIPINFGSDLHREESVPEPVPKPQYDPDGWKIGKKYIRKLSLNDDQSAILDRLWFADNVFNEIEYCRVQILKQFLRATDYLRTHCIPVNKSYATVIEELSEIIVCLQYNYRKESLNYRYTYDAVQTEIFNHILKLCENNVREVYGIKRKINTDFNYTHPDILHQYNRKIVSRLAVFLPENQSQILEADHRTNIILNENNTGRWKTKFETIKEDYSNTIAFEREIFRLAEVNVRNPSQDTIFLEASKFVAKHDKISALRLYLHYFDKDLNNTTFERKQLTRNIQKSLFTTSEQLSDFEQIINEFIATRNLQAAIEKASRLYLPKRKKIVIDRDAVENVQRQHSGTVALLEEYLKDEGEEETTVVQAEETSGEDELTIHITHHPTETRIHQYLEELNLSEVQQEILEAFEKQSFNIPQSEMATYLQSKNLFMGSTIDSINDLCFETLDDVLIEEEDEYFTINTDYYKKLLNND